MRCRSLDAAACSKAWVGGIPCQYSQGACRVAPRLAVSAPTSVASDSVSDNHSVFVGPAFIPGHGPPAPNTKPQPSRRPRGSRASIALLTSAVIPYKDMHPSFYTSRKCHVRRHPEGVVLLYAFRNGTHADLPTPHWEKVAALRQHLPNYDWIAYSDADTVMVATFSLQRVIDHAEASGVHMIVPREQDETKPPKWSFSNFAMMVRNSAVGRRFVDLWWEERTNLCGFFDQCSCWRALVRIMQHGVKPDHGLPAWRLHDTAPFDVAITKIAGRAAPRDGLEDVQVLQVLFSGTLFMQMKMYWYHKIYCPRTRLASAFSRAFVVHAQRQGNGTLTQSAWRRQAGVT
ncbi:hypothetical protein AB1Y20_016121 [Prymnesium parvum]|uniref:Protein xylosyltransferase n=1 Tax=Prymnesium parvum TaxID=97485 RepID=A0AB34K2Z7_PRYPA